jgi:hypothetical protein
VVDRQRASQSGESDGRNDGAVLQRRALYRVVNVQIEQLGDRWDLLDGHLAVLCECGKPNCVARIELAKPVYDAIRRQPARFMLKAGHELPGVDRVVERRDGYVVTEKSDLDAPAAARLDPPA